MVSDTDLELTDQSVFRGGLRGPRGRVSGLCASAQLPAAERRLMVWPPSAKKGSKRRIACLFDWGRS